MQLIVIVEGQAEQTFVQKVLGTHLQGFGITVIAKPVTTNRKLNKKGGIFDFNKIQKDLIFSIRQFKGSQVRFTTMLDFYALPSEFPGWNESRKKATPQGRVMVLEESFKKDINDWRFLPYIQLHEFESLLYCDLSQLAQRIEGSEQALIKLGHEVKGQEPEEINEGEETAPSKRIIKHVPQYKRLKVQVGAPAAAA